MFTSAVSDMALDQCECYVCPLSSHLRTCLLMLQVVMHNMRMLVGRAYHQLVGVHCVELHHCTAIQHWRSDGI